MVGKDKHRVLVTLTKDEVERIRAEIQDIKASGRKMTISRYVAHALRAQWEAGNDFFVGSGNG